jgi:hypothetical protein
MSLRPFVIACATLAFSILMVQSARAQPKPATLSTYYPRGYYAYPAGNTGPSAAPMYSTYYYPDMSYAPSVYSPYYSPPQQGYDPGFRAYYYAPGPSNFLTGLNSYYASPRYWNYYYAGY